MMELDDLKDDQDENLRKKEGFYDNSKQNDWKKNFLDINTIDEYIKKEGHKDLQKFTIIDCIGKGSESLVYKVKFNSSNKIFALKVIKKHKNKINLDELTVCRRLKHKNLINTLCYYADKNTQFDYMIMEMGNSNLINFVRKVLKRLTISETFLCMAAYQALQGLAYLHRLNIAHLDMKPQNLIITDYLDIKIIDFSVSMDYGKCMQKIDLFSLGVTIYVLAFGDFPFNMTRDDSDKEMYQKIKSGWKVEDNYNEFSTNFIEFLNGLLESDINKRMTIDEALNSHFIRGAQILMNEKENINNANSFLSYLITDHFRSFNEYMFNKS